MTVSRQLSGNQMAGLSFMAFMSVLLLFSFLSWSVHRDLCGEVEVYEWHTECMTYMEFVYHHLSRTVNHFGDLMSNLW